MNSGIHYLAIDCIVVFRTEGWNAIANQQSCKVVQKLLESINESNFNPLLHRVHENRTPSDLFLICPSKNMLITNHN